MTKQDIINKLNVSGSLNIISIDSDDAFVWTGKMLGKSCNIAFVKDNDTWKIYEIDGWSVSSNSSWHDYIVLLFEGMGFKWTY